MENTRTMCQALCGTASQFRLLCVAVTVLLGILHQVPGSEGLVEDNPCEETNPDGSITYMACLGSPFHLLRNADFTVSLDPPDSTCGASRQPYCTQVSSIPLLDVL